MTARGFFVLYRDARGAATPAVTFGDGETWPAHMRERVIYAFPITPHQHASVPLDRLRDHFDKIHAAEQAPVAGS